MAQSKTNLDGLTLDDAVQALPGVGPGIAGGLAKLRVETIYDLVMLAPRRYEDRTNLLPVDRCRAIGEFATVRGTLSDVKQRRSRQTRKPLVEFRVTDASGSMDLTVFNPRALDGFSAGDQVLLYGRVQRRKSFSLADVQIERWPETGKYERIVPIYPGNATVAPKTVARLCRQFVPHFAGQVEDPVPLDVRLHAGLIPLAEALLTVHLPGALPSMDLVDAAFRRLVFTELFLMELVLWSWRHAHSERHDVEPLQIPAAAEQRALQRLPYHPTEGQKEAFAAVLRDLQQPRQMMRLLQGDVGVGKTAVAFFAALMAVAAGKQVAVVAPTEILATQHYRTFRRLLSGSQVHVGFLSGSSGARERRTVLAESANGTCNILVGTHAVLEPDVAFADLRLVVVDEQQKFGVIQRQALVEKGAHPHVLAMTATPIPRTLAMTVFGDLDLTTIRDRPPNRPGYVTQYAPADRLDLVLAMIRDRAVRGQRTYVIAPRVTSKKNVAWTVKSLGERLRTSPALGEGIAVGVLHGSMSGPIKDQVMADFAAGRTQVLVASTVVEIGVDVPEATLMVVLDADQLGLAQLHQLRGRVGRGENLGTCVLVVHKETANAMERIRVLVKTDDGFEIAEEDLRLRGAGELFSTQQSGSSLRLRFATMSAQDVPILLRCRDEVRGLAQESGIDLSRHADLFERHFGEAVDALLSAS